ncbi:MAG: cytochrome c biogenesis protein CcdA, partial [Dietzia sp.]|nr:cytochrome c biogenesis protein CcdA [Dietzia sp.]
AIALAAAPVTNWLRGATAHLNRIGGVLLLVAGAYVAYYGVYELRVIGGGDAEDPVIEAAARVQEAMSAAVGAIGILPLTALLAIMVGAAGVYGWRRVVRRRGETAANG